MMSQFANDKTMTPNGTLLCIDLQKGLLPVHTDPSSCFRGVFTKGIGVVKHCSEFHETSHVKEKLYMEAFEKHFT